MADQAVNHIFWGDKRYHSLDFYLKQHYGQKIYKISLHGGMSCPNRDGTLDTRGCIFCSEGGSGDFASDFDHNITVQIEKAKELIHNKIVKQEVSPKYIAYFQAFSNTYGPISHLKRIFMEAILHPDIAIVSIATRPDCFNDEIYSLLEECNQIKPIWVELGLQTIHEETAAYIRRGYTLSVYNDTVKRLQSLGIPVIVHTILGLPGETKADMLKTIDYISNQSVQGIKLQLLHILKGTALGNFYEQGIISSVLSMEDYINLVIECMEHLPPNIVVHRITGDGPKRILLAPTWSSNKKMVLNRIHQEMRHRDTWQGKYNTCI